MKSRRMPRRVRVKPAAFAFMKGIGSVVDFTGSSFVLASKHQLGTTDDDATKIRQDFLAAEGKLIERIDSE
jgi:hypothetical protein